ncbi:MAG: hypothetical protein V7K21_16115 [Nostoc sp.]|uniref:hypothetical protein n=1 Tax=Nostoc sp. TaxID=1180 RepID=UPI002FF4F83C
MKTSIISSLSKGRSLWQEVRQGQTNEPPEKRMNEAWEFLIRRIWEHILTMEHTVLRHHVKISCTKFIWNSLLNLAST